MNDSENGGVNQSENRHPEDRQVLGIITYQLEREAATRSGEGHRLSHLNARCVHESRVASHHTVNILTEKDRPKRRRPARRNHCFLAIRFNHRNSKARGGEASAWLSSEKEISYKHSFAESRVRKIRDAGLYESICWSFAVLLPVKTVGVMGELRT